MAEILFRPLVLLVGDPGGFALNVVEKLLANFCQVLVYSKNKNAWERLTQSLAENDYLRLVDRFVEVDWGRLMYAVVVDDSFSSWRPIVSRKEVINIVDDLNQGLVKTVLVLPHALDKEKEKEVERFLAEVDGDYVSLFFVGQVFGPRVNPAVSKVAKLLNEVLEKDTVVFPPEDSLLYPVFSPDLARAVVKGLFSMSFSKGKKALLGKKLTSRSFFQLISTFRPRLKASFALKEEERTLQVNEDESVESNLQEGISETLSYWSKQKDTQKSVVKRKARPLVFKKINLFLHPERVKIKESRFTANKKLLLGIISAVFLLLTYPVFLFLVSAGSLYFVNARVEEGRLSLTREALSLSGASAQAATKGANFFSWLPYFGEIYTDLGKTTHLMKQASLVGERALKVAETGTDFLGLLLDGGEYDAISLSETLALELEALYKESGFLLSELSSLDGIFSRSITKTINRESVVFLRNKIIPTKDLVLELPDIVGLNEKRKYLLLFQNNMELRPTGGFIGSFAVISFDKGKIVDITVSDVYSADGQLKGHVEPPLPIREHLGEANWFLRDSNWDPDFRVSAKQAEWFLEKELGVTVDGVVGVDLEVAKGILAVTGKIHLDDYERDVDQSNLYEVTQYESEKDFFPGSRGKRNFLTSLTRELLATVVLLEKDSLIALSKSLLSLFNGRHLQLSFHEAKAQKAVESLGFDGGIKLADCGDSCQQIFLGLAEANLGVNKANLFISRQALFSSIVQDQGVKNELVVTLRNGASPSLGEAGQYKAFLRLLVNGGASFSSVEVMTGASRTRAESQTDALADRKEIGTLVEVFPGQAKSVVFTWREDFAFDEKINEYRLFWRKQAGTDQDPIGIKISFLEKDPLFVSRLTSYPEFTLTSGATLEYNTNLSRDFESRISW